MNYAKKDGLVLQGHSAMVFAESLSYSLLLFGVMSMSEETNTTL